MKRRGFSIVEGVVAIAVVALIAGIVWYAIAGRTNREASRVNSLPPTAEEKLGTNVSDLKTKQDLDKAAAEIEADKPDQFDAELGDVEADLRSF